MVCSMLAVFAVGCPHILMIGQASTHMGRTQAAHHAGEEVCIGHSPLATLRGGCMDLLYIIFVVFHISKLTSEQEVLRKSIGLYIRTLNCVT